MCLDLFVCIRSWNKNKESQIVSQIIKLFKRDIIDNCVGKVFLKRLYPSIKNRYGYQTDEKTSNDEEMWNQTVFDDESGRIVYEYNNKRLIINGDFSTLTRNAFIFYLDLFRETSALFNNVAYLLRRKEIDSVFLEQDKTCTQLMPDKLLEDGVNCNESFSITNYALYLSGTEENNVGDYSIGRQYLQSIKDRIYDYRYGMCWNDVIEWWTDSVLIYDEIEAVVVISWLYELEIYDPHKASSFTLNRIIRIIKSYLDREGENGAEKSSVIAFKAVLTDFGRILQERELIKSSILLKIHLKYHNTVSVR